MDRVTDRLAEVDSVGIVVETLNRMAAGFFERLPYIIIRLIVLGVFLVIGRLVSYGIHKVGGRTLLDDTLSELLGRLASVGVAALGILVAAVVIFPTFAPGDLVAGLGITSVAVGFAFKEVLQNFFAGILILWRRPFVVGDEIMVDSFAGTVVQIDARATRIRTYDGEKAVVPNACVYTSSLLVYTAFESRRLKLTVGISYKDDIEHARETILKVLRGTEGVLDDPEPRALVRELGSSSVNFTVYVWIASRPGEQWLILDRVAVGIKNALDEAGVEMPFPTSVVLLQDEREAAAEAQETRSNGRKPVRQQRWIGH